MDERVQIYVSGIVQGVGFRYFAAHVAKELGVRGIVRNSSEGRVEAIAEGPRASLDAFVEEMRKGPHTATVNELTTAWGTAEGTYSDFAVAA